ncbi:MAG: hypothetical protein F6K24_04385 [Okeania sp. SIO2D1]|nr:hypothetical protein [Okeania sp. SIO2D1]
MARRIIWWWCIVIGRETVGRWGDGEVEKDAEDIEGNIFLTVAYSLTYR